jgi:hypothetical protein
MQLFPPDSFPEKNRTRNQFAAERLLPGRVGPHNKKRQQETAKHETGDAMKLVTALAMTALMSTAAVADPAARANTADPGSAPLVRDPIITRPSNDAAAGANTTDPNSAATMDGRATTGFGKFDAAGQANTSDPGSINSGATNAAGRPANPMANPRVR